MKPTFPARVFHDFFAIAGLLALTGCVNLERSRDVSNPQVPGKVLAEQVCSGCHGPKGLAVSPNFPNLAGQTEGYLTSQLAAFRSHERSDPAGFEYMWGISRRLSDPQIQDIARYYASQPPASPVIEAGADRLRAGEAIFTGSMTAQGVPACTSCHGDHAQGNANFPRLAGQHPDYLVKQLLVFQRTDERPEGAVMKVVTHALTEAQMKDVATYLRSIPAL